ncbi:MAG: hypothetical protein Q9211_002589 [Gyalolechia sp. 1 TL-2023]
MGFDATMRSIESQYSREQKPSKYGAAKPSSDSSTAGTKGIAITAAAPAVAGTVTLPIHTKPHGYGPARLTDAERERFIVHWHCYKCQTLATLRRTALPTSPDQERGGGQQLEQLRMRSLDMGRKALRIHFQIIYREGKYSALTRQADSQELASKHMEQVLLGPQSFAINVTDEDMPTIHDRLSIGTSEDEVA